MKRFVWFFPALVVFLGIFLLSTIFSIPVHIEMSSIIGWDKLLHAFAYLVFFLSLSFGLFKVNRVSFLNLFVTTCFVGLYGLSLEWVQYNFFEKRSFDLYDAFSNLIGAFIGLLMTVIYNAIIK